MLKKICIFLVLLFVSVNSLTVLAQDEKKEEKSNENPITLMGKVVPQADEKGYMVFAGQAKNNTEKQFILVEINFEVLDVGGILLDSVTAPITGAQEGILEGGEAGFFEVRTTVRISTAGSYKYNIKWKSFTSGEEIKPQE